MTVPPLRIRVIASARNTGAQRKVLNLGVRSHGPADHRENLRCDSGKRVMGPVRPVAGASE